MPNAENDRLEYKEILTDNLKLEQTAVAFLNAKGGDICFGIKDNGKVVGIADPDDLQTRITNCLTDSISPSILGLLEVFTEEREAKTIVIARLASGIETPYCIKRFGRTPKGCYIRIGSANKPMDTKQIGALLRQLHISPLSEIKSRVQELTFNQLKLHYISKNKPWNDRQFAKNLGFLTEDGKYNYIAYMFADENRVSVRVPRFNGTEKAGGLINTNDYGGQCLITAINKVIDKLDVFNTTQARIEFPRRVEQRYVDTKALREAVINAFAHNDYTNEDTPISEVYDDRFVIVSYGNPLDFMDAEDFFTGMSKPRNPAIMKIFQDLEFVENNGFGNPYIVNKYGRDIFHFSRVAMRVTFKFDKSMEEGERAAAENNQKITRKMPEKYQKILDVLVADPSIGRQELAAKLNEKETAIRSRLDKLQNSGAIKRIGPDKGGHWEVVK